MAKAKKQTIDADGNIVEVELPTEQSQEAATFIPEPIKKKKQKEWYEYEIALSPHSLKISSSKTQM